MEGERRTAVQSYSIGSLDAGLVEAELRLEATYTVAYIAYAPLETRAALAEWDGDRLTVWTGTQRPFGVQAELAAAFQLPLEHVRVIVPDTGSGYGGKHTGDAAIEAARLARAAGRPVKVVWTREEEFTWAYFRPAGVIDVRSGARRDGTVTAWEFHTYNAEPAAIRPAYAFANQRIEFHPVQPLLRQGSYRALAATANHFFAMFARESHMDELAHALGIDPLELRLRNLRDDRLRGAAHCGRACRLATARPHTRSWLWAGLRLREGLLCSHLCGGNRRSRQRCPEGRACGRSVRVRSHPKPG